MTQSIYFKFLFIWKLRRTTEPRWSSRYSDWLRTGRLRGPSSSSGRINNFHFSISSRPTLRPVLPLIQWVPVPGAVRGVNMSSSSAKVKNGGALPQFPHAPLWRSAWLGRGTNLVLHPANVRGSFQLIIIINNKIITKLVRNAPSPTPPHPHECVPRIGSCCLPVSSMKIICMQVVRRQ
jgi:hypothetical protein